ncbi:MAG: hypothetical protein BroJett031_21420 [Betaproteobacteria bacterium]|nr:MAG: hypothetical protein BroJett031_21420 [Betaproteobacteria bacterium]
MSTSSPKWSRKSARRASGARNAALAAVAAAFVAACSGGGGDAGIGLPPGQGPINWGAVQTLATNASANASSVTSPAATIDGNGLASVLWSQIGMPLPGGGFSTVPLVGAADSSSGTTFGAAQAIELSAGFSAGDQISDLSARAGTSNTAVWRRRLASNNSMQIGSANREAGGWGVEYYPSNRPVNALTQELAYAANTSGTRVAVWTESDVQFNGVRRVQLSVRSGAAGWSQALSVSGTTQDASQPTVAIDSAGVAMIVWRQGAATGVLRARSYNTTSGQFGNELEVDPGQFTNDTRNPRVVALAPGSFLATWEQAGVGGAYDLRANTGSATAWQNVSATLELGAGTVDQSLVVAGPNATAYAVWRQNSTIFFSRYAAGTWSVARQVSGTVASHTPRVAVDGSGNAIFVWLQAPAGGGLDDLFYATFTASNSAISGAFQLDTETTGAAASPSLSVAANGAAVVAWLQSVGGQNNPNVVARVFRP